MRYSIVLLCVLLSGSPAASAAEADSSAVAAILRQARDAWHAPGIAATVVRDGEIRYLGGVGVRELGDDKAVTADTLFPIGSCTKAFAATALALLIEDGKADWDDLVRKHLPWFRLRDPLADRDVRLRDLLCHRIGLARHDLLWYRAPWSIEESVRRMAFLEPHTSFRSTFEYNNLAYLAAGLAISAIAKQPWHEFVRTRIFKPLKMNAAVFTSGDARKAADHASPHGRGADGKIVVVPWYDDDKQIRASGSIKANVRDLSHWLRFQLDGGKYEGKSLFSTDLLEETHTGQKTVEKMSAAARAAGAIQVNYGLGWYISEYRGHGILQHGGAVAGFRARIVLVPKKKLGLVLLTNLEDMAVVNAAGNNLLDHLLGLEKKDWNAFFKEEQAKAKTARAARLKKRPQPVPRAKRSRGLRAYTGTYREAAYGTVTIERDGDSLLLKWSSFRLPLKHFHYDTFVTPPKKRGVPASLADQFVRFEMDEDAEFVTLRFLEREFRRIKTTKKTP